MIAFPEVQKKAHAVIDSTIGKERLPELSDRGTFPYLEALFFEVLRWNLVTPLGEPNQQILMFSKPTHACQLLRRRCSRIQS
jgi:hypothetical protein